MFKYSLRLQLPPNVDFAERLDNLLDFCKTAKVDEVIFFIRSEELNSGHVTIEEAKPYIETIKKAREHLKKLGIKVSLNPWMTIGHYDGGKTFKSGQNFRGFVGENGSECKVVVCPSDKEWQKYYAELLNFYVETLSPDVIWLEDDFRLAGHRSDKPIKLGCFCDEHMKRYNARLGANYDRETFVKLLATDLKVRKAYLDICRETMESVFEYIAENVKGQRRFGFMTAGACFETGKRFGKMFDILSSGGREKPLNRLSPCCSRQNAPQLYGRGVNIIMMLNRFLTGDKADCVTEIENFPHTMYTKSVKFGRFQQLSSVPSLLTGTTLSIFEFNGNGVVNYKRLADMYAGIKPYLSAVSDLRLSPFDATGVNVLVNENVSYSAKIPSGDYVGYFDTTGKFTAWFELLGINCRYSDDFDMKNKAVAISGDVLRSLPPERVRKLFADNFVIIDGGGAEALFETGLNDLIGAKDCETFVERNSIHTFEEIASDEKIQGISKMRATSNYSAGDYVRIDYGDTEIKAFTVIKDYEENFFGCGITAARNALVLPHKIPNSPPYALYHPLREYVIKKALEESERLANETFFIEEENVAPYSFSRDGKTYLMCVNFCDDDYGTIHIRTGKKYKSVKIITPSNPTEHIANADYRDGTYIISENLGGEESYCVIFC